MSFGKMNTLVDIITTAPNKDAEGFVTKGDTILASTRAYFEERHGNEAWKNRATFSEATALFRFRKLPGVSITIDLFITCESGRYNITSVEDIKGRGMYTEVLAKKLIPSG